MDYWLEMQVLWQQLSWGKEEIEMEDVSEVAINMESGKASLEQMTSEQRFKWNKGEVMRHSVERMF